MRSDMAIVADPDPLGTDGHRALFAVCEPRLIGLPLPPYEDLRRLLLAPEHQDHFSCITGRPCPDCRHTAGLECVDQATCGESWLCRPCAAAWRMRAWYRRPMRQRRWLAMVARFPQIGVLRLTDEQGADVLSSLRAILRRDVRRMLRVEMEALIRRMYGTTQEHRG